MLYSRVSLSHRVANPREVEIQKITKFLGALNNPEIHRFVLLSRPTTLVKAVQHAQAYSAPKETRGQEGIAATGVNAITQGVDFKALALETVQPELHKLRQELAKSMKSKEEHISTSKPSQKGSHTNSAVKVTKKDSQLSPRSATSVVSLSTSSGTATS